MVTDRKNITIVHWREEWNAALAFKMCLIAVLLSSSLFVLYLVFSCFIFTVEYTWCRLGIAWVSIDSSPLCAVGRCLMQEFRNTQGLLFLFHAITLIQTIHTPQKFTKITVWHPLNAGLGGVIVWSSQVLQGFPPEQQDALKSQHPCIFNI